MHPNQVQTKILQMTQILANPFIFMSITPVKAPSTPRCCVEVLVMQGKASQRHSLIVLIFPAKHLQSFRCSGQILSLHYFITFWITYSQHKCSQTYLLPVCSSPFHVHIFFPKSLTESLKSREKKKLRSVNSSAP